MAAVTGVLAAHSEAFASFLTPALDAALTVDSVAGILSGLGSDWQSLFPGMRVFGKLVAIGQYQQFNQPGTLIPYAASLLPVGPGVPQGYTVASLAAALLATAAVYGSGPLYTFGPAGFAAVTRVRTEVNGDTRAPYSVEIMANPIQAGLMLEPV